MQHSGSASDYFFHRQSGMVMQLHRVAQRVAGFPAGVGVVAYTGNTQRRKVFTADTQDGLPRLGRSPRKLVVDNNVVEFAKILVDFGEKLIMKREVPRTVLICVLSGVGHIFGPQVHADDLSLGASKSEG